MNNTYCYIALLDILGYKDLIMNNETKEIRGLLENLPVYIQRSLAEGRTTSTNGRAHFDISHATLNSIIISDTLIFWTQNDDTRYFFELIKCIQSLMQFTSNIPALFLRGGITVGEFYHLPTGYMKTSEGASISHPMIFGKGLVAAHEIEKRLEIAGCLIDEVAIYAAQQQDEALFGAEWAKVTAQGKILLYDVPTKQGLWNSQWLVNWVSEATNPTRNKVAESFAQYNRKVDAADVKAKIANTLKFYDYAKEAFKNIVGRLAD